MKEGRILVFKEVNIPYLHYRDFRPSLHSNVLEDAGPQRPMQVPQDPQLVEGRRRAPPGKREVAPHL
jgi:hypothetical protein